MTYNCELYILDLKMTEIKKIAHFFKDTTEGEAFQSVIEIQQFIVTVSRQFKVAC